MKSDEERAREFLHSELSGWGSDLCSTEEDVPVVVALIRSVRAEALEDAARRIEDATCRAAEHYGRLAAASHLHMLAGVARNGGNQ